MQPYDHETIEAKWQKRWDEEKLGSATEASATPPSGHPSSKRRGEKSYVLVEFPYPSGDGLHVGHVRSYTALDAVARKRRMEGKSVLFPIGWDAFGLPTENYALKTGVHPRVATDKNIATFRRQMKALGLSFDWSREVDTTDPKYYRWTQWIFLQLFKRGLAYQATIPISWCPKDKIGLANEEVVAGKCERCGTAVERRMQTQWMLKITAYAERLLKDLDTVDYSERIKTQQVNWIGKSEGAEVRFEIAEGPETSSGRQKILIGTKNPAKKKRYVDILSPLGIDVLMPEDVKGKVAGVKVDEGFDIRENALRKARAYHRATGLPTLAVDEGLTIEKFPQNRQPGSNVRRIPGFEDERASDEDMLRYYSREVKKYGGESITTWNHAVAFVSGMTEKSQAFSVSSSKIVAVRSKKVKPGYPLDSLLVDLRTGKYRSELTDTEELQAIEKYISEVTQFVQSIVKPYAVRVFTTRPDTLFGATYLVLSPEHTLVDAITTENQKKVVEKYKKDIAKKSDLERTALEKEKTGVFTGAYAVNPVNNEKIPVWIADYVLMSYGTGAIMAVPAHDERDYAFSKKFKLPILKVIKPPSVMPRNPAESAISPGGWGHLGGDIESGCWTGEGTMVNSGKFDGMTSEEGRERIVGSLEKGGNGKAAVNYKLRDWVFSRQHYWGEPIPVVHCEACKKTAESTKWKLNFYESGWQQLQAGYKTVETRALNPEEKDRYLGDIRADDIIKGTLKGTDEVMYLRVTERKIVKHLNDLLKQPDFLRQMVGKRTMPKTEADLERAWAMTPDYIDRIKKHGLVAWTVEHVIPGVVPWEKLPVELPEVEKYQPTGTGESPLAAITDWVNVECPHCGGPAKRETDTMPNWAGSSWYFLRYCDPQNGKEFASRKKLDYWMPVDLYNGGMEHTTLHLLYSRFWHKFLFDHGYVPTPEPYQRRRSHGMVLASDGRKMSKSFGNVVNPDELVKQYGADSVRLYEMFMGPFEDAIPWDTKGIVGMRRFLDRVWQWGEKVEKGKTLSRSSSLARKYIHNIERDVEGLRFNTCISELMKWVNEWRTVAAGMLPQSEFEIFLLALSPFAPFITEHWWHELGNNTLIANEPWPDIPEAEEQSTATYTVQVNGKLRAVIELNKGLSQGQVETAAKEESNVARYLTGKPKKVVFIKDKLINFVI